MSPITPIVICTNPLASLLTSIILTPISTPRLLSPRYHVDCDTNTTGDAMSDHPQNVYLLPIILTPLISSPIAYYDR